MSTSALVARLPAFVQKQIVRAMYLRKGKFLQDMTRMHDGRFTILKVRGDYVPAEGLSWYLDYDEYHSIFRRTAGWGYQPKEGDTVVDIGAGIGEQAIVLSRLVGRSGRVICIEANPEAFSLLQQIVNLNKLHNVEAYNVAVSSTNEPLEIEVGRSFLAGTIGGGYEPTATHTVQGTRLDDFLRSIRVDRAALLKSNIEGAERFVVETLGDYVQRVDNFAIACHDFRYVEERNPFFQTRAMVQDFLERSGRQVRTQSTGLPWIDDWLYAGSAA